VGWDLKRLGLSGLRVFNFTYFEVLSILLLVVILSELVYSIYSKYSSECINSASWLNFITGQIVISNKVLPWLIQSI